MEYKKQNIKKSTKLVVKFYLYISVHSLHQVCWYRKHSLFVFNLITNISFYVLFNFSGALLIVTQSLSKSHSFVFVFFF